MSTKVVIVLDAFRADYITPENTPFLFELSQRGTYIEKLHPSPGFCERNEIITGKHTLESGFFTAIGYDPVNSPFKNYRFLLAFLSFILPKSPDNFLNKLTRKVIGKVSKFFQLGMTSYRIPLWDLANYRLTEDQFPLQHTQNNDDSLISVYSSKGNVFFDSFTSLRDRFSSTDESRLAKALHASTDSSNSLYLVYIANADAVGHKFGPYSVEQTKNINSIDNQLKEFVQDFNKNRGDAEFSIIGDHGMALVTDNVDVSADILNISKKYGYKYGVDFSFFLDSTYCRLWLKNKKDKLSHQFINDVKKSPVLTEFGLFIEKNDYESHGIPDSGRLYGDYIWCANTGVLIWPDFFHNDIANPPLGMHGYLIENEELLGFCIQSGDNIEQVKIAEMQLADVYKLIRKECND
jgi:predicted AlkP superfamily pyrophosphatase or phosphodiesterase